MQEYSEMEDKAHRRLVSLARSYLRELSFSSFAIKIKLKNRPEAPDLKIYKNVFLYLLRLKVLPCLRYLLLFICDKIQTSYSYLHCEN